MHAVIPALVVLQAPTYTMTEGQYHALIWFTGLIAFWLFIQAVALAAVAFMVVKLLGKVEEVTNRFETKALAITDRFETKAFAITDRFEGKLYPLLDNVKEVVNDSVPKIKRVTENIAETTDVYRAKLADVEALVTDTTQKVKKQSDQLDRMVTTTLNTAGNLVGRVEHAVLSPVRQGSALISGIKTAAEQLVENFSKPSHPKTPKPVAFEGENIYTGLDDDYHA